MAVVILLLPILCVIYLLEKIKGLLEKILKRSKEGSL